MISITKPLAPAFLTDASNRWMKETQAAILHYSNPARTKEFSYKAYNDAKLKEELKKVFSKCAYCESKYGSVYDGDIEHFRPKGRVSEKNPKTPGYYWLANDWDNLLLSCQHCNQRRKHKLYGASAYSSKGKVDQFPLRPDCKHASHHTQSLLDEEKARLLLNPCVPQDHPESHFSYEEKTAVIIPLTDMGEKSIQVYALLRPELVAERNARRLFIFKQMQTTKRALDNFNDSGADQDKNAFDIELENLLFFGNADEPYTGMARYFIRKFLKENKLLG